MEFKTSQLFTEHAEEWMRLRREGVRDFPFGFLIGEDEADRLTLKKAEEIIGFGGMHGVFHRGKMIGFGGLRQEFFERTRHRAEVGPFFVVAKYQGTGAAQLLMNWIIERAQVSHVKQLELFVDTESVRAIRFYEKCGFERIATHPECVFIDGQYRDDHFYRMKIRDR